MQHRARPSRPVRRRDRRRRAGRARRGGVRVVGGSRRARRRARVDRRAGGHEHAHPQLPRVLARAERRRARPARVPAGVGLRRDLPADARGRVVDDGRRRLRGRDLGRGDGRGAQRDPRDGCLVPPARRPGARGPRRCRVRLVAVRGEAVHRRKRLHRRRRQLGRPGGRPSRALRGGRDARLPGRRALEDVAVPRRRDPGQGEHPRPSRDAGRRGARRRAARAPDVARAGGRRDGRREEASSSSSAPSRGPTGCPPEIERDERGFVVAGPTYETSVPGIFAIGDLRADSVKRVASAVGEGSVVIQHVHRYLASVEERVRTWAKPLSSRCRRTRGSPRAPSAARPRRPRPAPSSASPRTTSPSPRARW